MAAWFQANIGTIVISALLIGAVVAIIASLIRKKKRGGGCGCGCDGCHGCSNHLSKS